MLRVLWGLFLPLFLVLLNATGGGALAPQIRIKGDLSALHSSIDAIHFVSTETHRENRPASTTIASRAPPAPGGATNRITRADRLLPANAGPDGTRLTRAPKPVASVETPHGTAVQDAVLAGLRDDVARGRQIFRGGNFGRSKAAEGQFFSPDSPLSPGFADRVGAATLGQRTPDFVIGGRVKPGASFVTRKAPPFGKNAGGAPEIVVEPGGVKIDFFHMP